MGLNKNLLNSIVAEGKIEIAGETKDFPSILIPIFLHKTYGEQAVTYTDNLEVDLDQISGKLNDFKNKYHIKPILTGLELSFNIHLNPCAYGLIEDFDDKLEVSPNWKNISNKENVLYECSSSWTRICKDEKLFESFKGFNFYYNHNEKIMDRFLKGAKSWLEELSQDISNIRENVSKDNSNPYYWKELKKRIEILDLNFLEFNAYAIQKMDLAVADRIDLHLKEKYSKKILDSNNRKKENLFKYLNEIRTGIANLSTPGHTHDEMILQEETEKVNERILMLSFIAMSIPTIGAILTPGISTSIKTMAGIGVILLPVTYLLIRKIIKKIRFNKSRQLELGRITTQLEDELKECQQHFEDLKKAEKIPPDFKDQILKVATQSMEQYEDRIKSLKEKS